VAEGSGPVDYAPVDYATVFDAVPTPFVVLRPDLVVVGVNRAYLEVTGRRREDLVGQSLFDAFPDPPDDSGGDGTRNLRASLERVRATLQRDTMPVQRYDIPDGTAGGFVQRYWSPVTVPVLDGDGSLRWLLHRVEDVTDFVLHRHGSDAGNDEASRRTEEVEADLYARAVELREARDAEAATARRLAALSDAALALADAQTVVDVADVVIDRGLAAVGSDGGAVGVRDDEAATVRLAFVALGGQVRQQFETLPLAGPLPASVAARTGRRILLRDRAAGLAWSSAMADVHAATGMDAWASLPLRAGGRLLGSLTMGWQDAHDFAVDEVELLEAFAAQCAQALDRV
jgi:hypothetical protein